MASERYQASCPIEYEDRDGKKQTKWSVCGWGGKTKNGEGVWINLDVLPVNGKLVIKKWEPKESYQRGGGGNRGRNDDRGGGYKNDDDFDF